MQIRTPQFIDRIFRWGTSSCLCAVGRYEGKFSKMSVVVHDADLERLAMSVKFGRGEPWHPQMNFFFGEGARA
ncbi:MAG: hypothetical protein ABI704_25155 [Kofleriaceae bacterium]